MHTDEDNVCPLSTEAEQFGDHQPVPSLNLFPGHSSFDILQEDDSDTDSIWSVHTDEDNFCPINSDEPELGQFEDPQPAAVASLSGTHSLYTSVHQDDAVSHLSDEDDSSSLTAVSLISDFMSPRKYQ